MSGNLKAFLEDLGKDPEKLAKFKQDPHGAMDEHGLSDEHKQLVLSGDKEKIKEEAGADDATVNLLIV